MKRINNLSSLMILVGMILFCLPISAKNDKDLKKKEYVVLVSKAVRDDVNWGKVVEALKTKHDALVIEFDRLPEEVLGQLKEAYPRYVAVVDKPININQAYVEKMHKLSRVIDEDIFEDFLWGIITGYNAESALRVIEDASMPLVVKTALSTAPDMEYTGCFDQCALIDQSAALNFIEIIRDFQKSGKTHVARANWREKIRKQDTLTKYTIEVDSIAYMFQDLYKRLDPEFLLSCSYDMEDIMYIVQNRNDQFIEAKNGQLFLKNKAGQISLAKGTNRRLYLAIGNGGGSMFGNNDNLAVGWMNDGNVSGLAGYSNQDVWHGQAGWGTWKFWMTTPGRYTFNEAMFLNMQFMLSRLYAWSPKLLELEYPKTDNVQRDYGEALTFVSMEIKEEVSSLDLMGYLFERDLFVYYGDPKWDVRLDGTSTGSHFDVTFAKKGNKCTVTICTDKDFTREQMTGNYFKEEKTPFSAVTVGRLPFSYFFPERLKNPKLAKKLKFEGHLEFDENFMFIHDCYFEPNQTYQIVFTVGK